MKQHWWERFKMWICEKRGHKHKHDTVFRGSDGYVYCNCKRCGYLVKVDEFEYIFDFRFPTV